MKLESGQYWIADLDRNALTSYKDGMTIIKLREEKEEGLFYYWQMYSSAPLTNSTTSSAVSATDMNEWIIRFKATLIPEEKARMLLSVWGCGCR